MSRLANHINSEYISAFNRLQGKSARRKVVAYVESYDDVFFWSTLLSLASTDKVQFEVMLPSRTSLCKGKKIALGNRLGPNMIACVDADYDYLMQGSTPTSRTVCESPYVIHTYAYSIENHQCYAPTLRQVCVMATLNDHRVFDFEDFMSQYSRVVWPLFVWNVWAYTYGTHSQFSLSDFASVVELRELNFYHPEQTLEKLRRRINQKVAKLQRQFPKGRSTYKPLRDRLLSLGLTPATTYLYMRGHDLHDVVISPLLTTVCDALRREREREIRKYATHSTQMQNELAAYQHATAPFDEMLRKHTHYVDSPLYRRIVADAARIAENAGTKDKKQDVPETPPKT